MPLKGERWSKKSFQAFDKSPIEWKEFRRCSWPEELEGEREKVFQEKGRTSVKSSQETEAVFRISFD